MKQKFLNLALVLGLAALAGCEKYENYEAPFQTAQADKARLKVVYASAYATNPAVQLSIDDVRVSGLITGRTPFPGGGYNTTGSNFPDYLIVEPGTRKFSIAIPKVGTNVDSVLLYTTQVTVAGRVNQTLHVMDTFTKTKSLLVQDNISSPGKNMSRYRFVNLMPNAPLVDLYYGTVRVATGVAYNTPGVEFTLPTPATALAWTIRETGTLPTSTAMATYSSASTSTSDRVYTAFAMGYKGSAATNTRPYISFSLNR